MYDARSILNSLLATPTSTLRPRGWVTLTALLVIFCAGCATPLHAGHSGAEIGSLSRPDAVFELWEQDWTLSADGSLVYREKRHLRLNSDRVFRTYGNPRIAYDADTQEVEVLLARTRLPGGDYTPLADYSTVEVAPDAAGGWPAFGNLRQRVMVMGGIEPGCVLETEHQITTKAGARPYLAADLRIDHKYPVRAHTVTVTVPFGEELSPVVSGLPEDSYVYSFEQHASGDATHRWVFPALEGRPDEPQARPWYERGVRLSFATAPDADTWITQRLATIDAAADESPLLSKLAGEWTKDANTDAEKLRALQKKLASSFNFVNFDVAWRPASPRNAPDVIYYNYGLPAESAAVLLALARAVGVAVQPALLVADNTWEEKAPQAAMVAAYVVIHEGPDELEIWHPQKGRVRRDKRWAGHTLLAAKGSKIARTSLPAWRDPDQSRCAISGNVTIAENGKYTGKLSIKTTGLFVSPNALETRDGQEQRLKAIVDHLLPDAKLADFTLKSLTPGTFEAEVEIESEKALEKPHECYQLELAQTSPALADVSVPLSHSRRMTATRLAGPFDERIELAITWPEAWKVEIFFSNLEQSQGPWGAVAQMVSPTENGLRLTRHTRVAHRDLQPASVLALRKLLNELRSDHARTLLLKP